MIEFIDKTSERAGTPIDRAHMMALQGFSNCDISEAVNELGERQIIQDYIDRNERLVTTFKLNGQIVETLIGEKEIAKTTSFDKNIITERIGL